MRWLLFFILAASMAGCSDKPPERVWRPSDHGQPPEVQQADQGQMPQPATQVSPQETPAEARARAALALWRVSCASCHGESGRGNGPEAPPVAQMPDMTDLAWQKSQSDADLANAIRQGRGMMPAFGDRINPQGVAALIARVRGFAASEATEAQRME